jgi:hypothetical protein
MLKEYLLLQSRNASVGAGYFVAGFVETECFNSAYTPVSQAD